MFCEKCGNKINDGELFCQNCGTKISDEFINAQQPVVQQPVTQQAPAAYTYNQQTAPSAPKAPRKPIPKKFILGGAIGAGVIAVACIAVVILLWFYLRNLNKAVYDSAKAAANEIEVNNLKEVTDEENNELNEKIEKIQNEVSLLKTNITATSAITMSEVKDSTKSINNKIAEVKM